MINDTITQQIIKSGGLKKGSTIIIGANQMFCFSCKITKIIKSGGDTIVKMKTGKDYPLGHKYIFRSLEEII